MATIVGSTGLGISLGEVARRRVVGHGGVLAVHQDLQKIFRTERNDGLAHNKIFHQLQWGRVARDRRLEGDVEFCCVGGHGVPMNHYTASDAERSRQGPQRIADRRVLDHEKMQIRQRVRRRHPVDYPVDPVPVTIHQLLRTCLDEDSVNWSNRVRKKG